MTSTHLLGERYPRAGVGPRDQDDVVFFPMRFPMKFRTDRAASRGFTLIELLVVIAIVPYFAMVDGSVHFVKDTINTWSIDPTTCLPVGLTFGGSPALYSDTTPFGVYQAISSRNRGEVIDASAF
jgi:prepilin-type N-terminal cleavage/methylation domain-containing protein